MCGIVGYWNNKNKAFPIILDSLKNLEYRGYDSFGFAIIDNSKINSKKYIGRVGSSTCDFIDGKIGIGHTRWATHGKVSEKNSHPHFDCTKKIAVVHNGIIENYQKLKNCLSEKHDFKSDTDTEVIAHLIEDELKKGLPAKDAVINAGKKLEGRNAFAVLDLQGQKILAFRNGSPLIIGISRDSKEFFIASDIQAFINKTNKVMYLDDMQAVSIGKTVKFYDAISKNRINKRIIKIKTDFSNADKGNYEHFMLKEIMEQKKTIIKAINQNKTSLMKVASEINKAKGVFFIGCGTAAKVCHIAEYIFSKIASKHVNYIPASEFSNYKDFLIPETLVIAVSQSGETADVLEAIKIAKQKNSKIISIVNVPESPIAKISDYAFFINAGAEKAVASTKATTSQIAVMILLSYACSGNLIQGEKMLIDASAKINDMLNPRYSKHIKKIAKKIFRSRNIFIIGRGINYPVALEASIKIMEVSYIHAQGFAGGELKHGPIALIEKNTPVIAVVSEDTKNEILSNAIETKSRGAKIIGISPENNKIFDYWIKVPKANIICSPIINLIPIQLLAYYLGTLKGYNVDYPRSLAKSVTVK